MGRNFVYWIRRRSCGKTVWLFHHEQWAGSLRSHESSLIREARAQASEVLCGIPTAVLSSKAPGSSHIWKRPHTEADPAVPSPNEPESKRRAQGVEGSWAKHSGPCILRRLWWCPERGHRDFPSSHCGHAPLKEIIWEGLPEISSSNFADSISRSRFTVVNSQFSFSIQHVLASTLTHVYFSVYFSTEAKPWCSSCRGKIVMMTCSRRLHDLDTEYRYKKSSVTEGTFRRQRMFEGTMAVVNSLNHRPESEVQFKTLLSMSLPHQSSNYCST